MKLRPPSPVSIPILLLSLAILGGIFYLNRSPASLSESLPGYHLDQYYGNVQVFSAAQKTWIKPERGYALAPGDILKTGPDAELEFQIPDLAHLRLKSNAELLFPGNRKRKAADPAFRMELREGSLFAAAEKETLPHPIEIQAGNLQATSREAFTLAAIDAGTPEGYLGVLRGKVRLEDLKGNRSKTLESMQKASLQRPAAPEKLNRQAWSQVREAYDLIPKTAASEAAQLDLSKKAGNLFEYVFDHGTFYTPKLGFADREFSEDPLSGDVYLEIEYDVFPVGSFVGMYLKTRDLDMSKFKALRFLARRDPREKGYPECFKIELKSVGGVARAFVPRRFEKDWGVYDFPLHFSKTADIREITLVFLQERIGGYSKGFLQLKGITLVPKDEPAPAVEPAPETASPAASGPSQTAPEETPPQEETPLRSSKPDISALTEEELLAELRNT